jgi:hypothetical protein
MKIKRFKNGTGIQEFTYHTRAELVSILDEWKKEFMDLNQVDKTILLFGMDRSYDRFCAECDDYLKDFKLVD